MANYKITKAACYSSYFTMSTVFCLPPILFVTFHEMYGISWTLLGTLVLVNFCTQLVVDLFFSFFSEHFNVKKVAGVMPLLTTLGFLIYAIVPTLFPSHAFAGLLTGTVIFSISSGLCEVFLSPTIAAIPSDNPGREMTLLHSLYAIGIFSIIVVSTVVLSIIGNQNWMYLTIGLAFLPLITAVLFFLSPFPNMNSEAIGSGGKEKNNMRAGLVLCFGCIFFGGCAENVMTNWISGYVESALKVNKTLGDILGMAMFAVTLGVVRLLYARFGKNIINVLLAGMSGSVVCYLVAALSPNATLSFVACIMTGACTSMLWPGSLILMEENVKGVGVAAYALMAAGGDFGSSVAPQLMGYVVDSVSASAFAQELGKVMQLSAEQIGMKTGMLVSGVFPLIGVLFVLAARRYFRKNK